MKTTLNRFFRVFATVVACLAALPAQAAPAMLMPSAPTEVPDITYTDAAGESHHLAAHRGKVVVLHFWAKWCPPCVDELPEMQRALAALDAGEELVVLPLSLDREVRTVEEFFAANAITLPVRMDPRGQAMRALKVAGLPSTVVINREGREIARLAGVVDWESEAVLNLLRDALAE